jgi:two-component sensor histidine kinase
VPCGLIVNELVANALKHGFPEGRSGSVRVEVAREEGRMLRLTVMDDGVGLPPDFELTTTASLGLQLATILAKQIDGQMEMKRGQGTRFDITFPAPIC